MLNHQVGNPLFASPTAKQESEPVLPGYRVEVGQLTEGSQTIVYRATVGDTLSDINAEMLTLIRNGSETSAATVNVRKVLALLAYTQCNAFLSLSGSGHYLVGQPSILDNAEVIRQLAEDNYLRLYQVPGLLDLTFEITIPTFGGGK